MINVFKDIFGQREVVERLSLACDTERLHHAYLFSGPEGVGKDAVALELVKIVNCQNRQQGESYCGECRSCKGLTQYGSDDILYLFPEKKADVDKPSQQYADHVIKAFKEKGKKGGYGSLNVDYGQNITIDHIRNIREFSRYNSFTGKKKFIILNPAETMNKEASNALLKVLEEPPKNFYFILITQNPNLLLETIRSRCSVVEFQKLTNDDIKNFVLKYYPDFKDLADETAKRSFGNINRSEKLLTDEGRVIFELEDKLVKILNDTIPPETVNELDTLYDSNGKLSDNQLKEVLSGALNKIYEKLLEESYAEGKNMTSATNKILLNITELFSKYSYMIKRKINPKLLLLNLYLSYREELKKWKIKI